jgi:polyketide cyclase/dehydrase/lipid transport protein
MSPVVIQAEVDINRSPEEVFDYCSDHQHEPEWNPMMTRAEKLTPGPISAGTRYSAEFAKGPPMIMECTQYQRPATWSLTGTSRALTARGGWRVLPTADGAHLVMYTEMEPHGLLKLAAPLLRRRMRPMFERDLRNIKARLEGSHPSPEPGPGCGETQTTKQAAAGFRAGQRAAGTRAPGPPASGSQAALRAVKAIHTLAWLSIEASMAYVLYAGFARRSDRRVGIAAAVVATESLIFAGNGFRCPLTQVAERLGAERGSVTDIYLPRWFAHNLPAIHIPLIGLAGYLHARNLRARR